MYYQVKIKTLPSEGEKSQTYSVLVQSDNVGQAEIEGLNLGEVVSVVNKKIEKVFDQQGCTGFWEFKTQYVNADGKTINETYVLMCDGVVEDAVSVLREKVQADIVSVKTIKIVDYLVHVPELETDENQ